jgi:hypothetical protein
LAACTRWAVATIDVIVHDADVIVSIPGRTSIPEEARTTSITHEFFSEQQEKHLDRLAVDYGNLAHRAFDLWIRTLRWKADDYRIGQSEFEWGGNDGMANRNKGEGHSE